MSALNRYENSQSQPTQQKNDKGGDLKINKSLLTHFICIPLLTATSTPQLKTSLAHLRDVAEHLQATPEDEVGKEEDKHEEGLARGEKQQRQYPKSNSVASPSSCHAGKGGDDSQLPQHDSQKPRINHGRRTSLSIPPSAFRPLGTLHLTLGVMNLKEPEQIEGALKLLQDLDLDNLLQQVSQPTSTSFSAPAPETATEQDLDDTIHHHHSTPPPLTISLCGLHTFQHTDPRRTSVVHTQPSDPTSRLLPFCEGVMSAFRNGGFLVERGEGKGKGKEKKKREFTLHATVINTVYAKPDKAERGENGRDTESRRGRGGKGRRKSRSMTFDARELLEVFNDPLHYQHHHHDDHSHQLLAREKQQSTRDIDAKTNANSPMPPPDPTPFTFASDIEIDRIQICEMGAKSIPWSSSSTTPPGSTFTSKHSDSDNDNTNNNSHLSLGQIYHVVGEKKNKKGTRDRKLKPHDKKCNVWEVEK